jgi:hypothetical protein
LVPGEGLGVGRRHSGGQDAAGRPGSGCLGDATPGGVLVEDFGASVRGPHAGFDDETPCPVLVALLTGPKPPKRMG